jgi:hypothetical protein
MSPAQALIAAMLTPALLILAAASLIATALVRLGRVVDRVRVLNAAAAPVPASDLALHEYRARLALSAVTAYFVAVTLFVVAGIAIAADAWLHGALTWVPITLTLAGMVLIVVGAAAMVWECRQSATLIAAEIGRLR